MHPTTGSIATFETAEDANNAGYTVRLKPEIIEKIYQMTRLDRLRELGWSETIPATTQQRKTARKQWRKLMKEIT